MKNSLTKDWESVIGWPLPFEYAETYYNGVMLQLTEEKLCYVVSNGSVSLSCFFLERSKIAGERILPVLDRLALPWRWNTKRQRDSWLLCCDKVNQFEITVSGDVKQVSLPEEVLSPLDLRHLSIDPFLFDRFLIEHKGAYGFVCRDAVTKEKLWTLTAQGYLYTDMVRIGDRVLFGTAEHGGFVYCIDLPTGKIAYQINTRGTAKIQFGEGFFVCYELGKVGKLLLVETETGQILDSAPLYKTSIKCPLFLMNNRDIFIVSFRKNGKDSSEAVLSKYSVCPGEAYRANGTVKDH